MNEDEITAYLMQRGVRIETRDVEHGRQIKAYPVKGDTVTATVYNSGKVVIGGKKSELRDALEAWKNSGFAPVAATTDSTTSDSPIVGVHKKIFIVYGHNTTATDALELLLLKMGLDPIRLDSLPASGATIIEQLESYLVSAQNVGFACVLLTADDQGHRAESPQDIKYRARQNVILELGMVLARLGRARVAILYQDTVERPSDIDGLLYLRFTDSISEVGAPLFKELRAAGYNPNVSAL